MSDYIFKYTNPSTASFVVKPYTANGPASPSVTTPYTNSSSGISAVSVNTPMVLVGKGVTDYGQVVQNNILYLAENFCNPTRPIPPMTGMLWYKSSAGTDSAYPSDPTAVGLYMWDGTSWNNVLINGKITTNLNVNGNRITNVGDAIAATDALNTTSANGLYLSLNGGTLNGNLTLAATRTVKVSAVPTANEDVTNKIYVDAADLQLQTNISDVAADLVAATSSFNTGLGNAYLKTGGTISGDCTVIGGFAISPTSSFTLPAGAGVVDFGSRVIKNTGDPVLAYDAANKVYVDTKIALELANYVPPGGGGTGTADGVVTAAELNATTGELTLTRSNGLPVITATGLFAQKTHAHAASDIQYDTASNQRQSELHKSNPAISTVAQAIRLLDQRVSDLSSPTIRLVVEQTVLNNKTFILPHMFEFVVWADMVQIYLNGIKQYCNIRADAYTSIDGVGAFSLVDVAPGAYTQTITVDGTPYTMNFTITSTTQYKDLFNMIRDQIVAQSIPVALLTEQGIGDIIFTFVSTASGSGHSVSLATIAPNLFATIPTNGGFGTTSEMILSYEEVGTPTQGSVRVDFATAPPVGSLIEFTVHRSMA